MRILLWVFLLSYLIPNMAWSVPSKTDRAQNDGLSINEFHNFAAAVTELPGNIQAIRIFRGTESKTNSVAVTTFDSQHGWRLFVFSSDDRGHFGMAWQSGDLNDTFRVASPSDLILFNLGSEDGIVFHGCARHACPDVFSIMLYVPSRQTAFIETYVWGKVTYSFDTKESKYSKYESILNELVKAQRNMSE